MTKEEIHNIYLYTNGKAEGIAEVTGSADFPVLFANAILEYAKRPWKGLTDKEILKFQNIVPNTLSNDLIEFVQAIEAKLRSKNHD